MKTARFVKLHELSMWANPHKRFYRMINRGWHLTRNCNASFKGYTKVKDLSNK